MCPKLSCRLVFVFANPNKTDVAKFELVEPQLVTQQSTNLKEC